MYKPISRSKKFIPLSTWLREGKTFHRGVFLYLKKWKTSTRNVDFFLSCVQFCRMRSSTSLENSFTKRRAGAKKSYFFKQRTFCRCKGKTGDCLPKIERWWRFWIAEDGLSKCKACSNQSLGWRIFYAFPAGCCGTWPLWEPARLRSAGDIWCEKGYENFASPTVSVARTTTEDRNSLSWFTGVLWATLFAVMCLDGVFRLFKYTLIFYKDMFYYVLRHFKNILRIKPRLRFWRGWI